MKKLFGLGVIAATAISFGGCMPYFTATQSVQGRAYVTSGKALWNCDATSGEPVCYQVKQVLAVAAK
jgi:hypothetical protein